MRPVFFALLLANLILFVWGQGYLGAKEAGREPERLQQQVTPEKLRIVPATLASNVPPACQRIEALSAGEADSLLAAIEPLPEWEGRKQPQTEPPAHWVVMTELSSRALAERKIAELRQLGVREGEIVEDAALGPFVVSLGVFRGQQNAEEHLEGLRKKGVRSARLAQRDLPTERFAVELRAPADALAEKIPALTAVLTGASVGECAPL